LLRTAGGQAGDQGDRHQELDTVTGAKVSIHRASAWAEALPLHDQHDDPGNDRQCSEDRRERDVVSLPSLRAGAEIEPLAHART
jgi:hypothetical protein